MSKIGSYITVLISNGYIIESGNYKGHQLYCISPIGLQVIEDLNKSYERQLYKFYQDNNISL
jgi:predicted transcriptional regulator